MDRRLLLLLASVPIIAGLTAWRLTRPPRIATGSSNQQSIVDRDAPLAVPPSFELPDQYGNFVKFERYRTRQGVVVVFFRGDASPQIDEALVWLRDHYDAVTHAGYEVLGISTQTGATIRNDALTHGKEWPFPILHDIHLRDPEPAPVHHLWQMLEADGIACVRARSWSIKLATHRTPTAPPDRSATRSLPCRPFSTPPTDAWRFRPNDANRLARTGRSHGRRFVRGVALTRQVASPRQGVSSLRENGATAFRW